MYMQQINGKMTSLLLQYEVKGTPIVFLRDVLVSQ